MLLDTAYIISYLPKDDLRAKRLEIHDRQLEYWKSKGLRIVVYAQGYEKGDFREGVEYIVNPSSKILRPGPARNILLKEFYKTDQDFCLMLDNDIILYEGEKYCDSDNLVSILKEIPLENLNGVDVFEPINPTQTPFSAFFEENKDILKSNLFFRRKPNISGASLFIRNFPKFEIKEFYFKDWYDESTGKIIMGEDVAFGLELIKEGRGVYSLVNAVRKDMGWTLSSWCKNPEMRKSAFDSLKETVQALGVEMKKGNLDWSGYADRYAIPKKVLAPKKKTLSLLDMMS